MATDTPFQRVTMYMWPPGRPRYAADDCTTQVRLVGNPITCLVEITCVAASDNWRDLPPPDVQKIELASVSGEIVAQMVNRVLATVLKLLD